MTVLSWQQELQNACTDLDELCRILSIPARAVRSGFPLLVPRGFIDLMERGNPNDPLLLQVLPRIEEHENIPGFSQDPLGEIGEVTNSGVLNKYSGRSLLLVVQSCGVHCRFCFRRHFPPASPLNIDELLAPIRNDRSIEEVILSGGDPLVLDDETLDRLLQTIIRIEHVQRIRIHSRLPIVLPNRLTQELVKILTLPIPLYMVLHINHPNELSGIFLERHALFDKLVWLSQTVLLRHINDHADILEQLFRRLINARIIPYYLHQLDKVSGAAHFEVSAEEGLRLIDEIRERLPGYAVPAYVREVKHKSGKEVVK